MIFANFSHNYIVRQLLGKGYADQILFSFFNISHNVTPTATDTLMECFVPKDRKSVV